jgi:hypothetical protein
MADHWHLLFTFPNFIPPTESPFVSDDVVICSADDQRVRYQLAASPWRASTRLLLRRFSTDFGERYRPGCLLLREGAPETVRAAEALSSFRNLSAIATTTQGWGGVIGDGVQWVTL